MKVPFIGVKEEYRSIKKEIDAAMKKVIHSGNFILGDEVRLFEKEFARYCRVKYAVGVNSGTDALFLGLLSLGIGKDDEVIVPIFTYIATALAVSFTGAKPVFVDIDERTYNIDINKIERVITKRTKAIIPVHLYGQPADMKGLLKIANKYKLKVVEDCAQAAGAEYKIRSQRSEAPATKIGGSAFGGKVGAMGDIGCFSFYPTKNLSAYGDGGMVITDDKKRYDKLTMLRDYGRKTRYEHKTIGYNSRLDTIQAAILRVKLKYLDKCNKLRRDKAAFYNILLNNNRNIVIPEELPYGKHVYHVYAVRVKNRNKTYDLLRRSGIEVLIHYPMPLHLQEVYKDLGYKKGDFPVAERVAREVISLPIYPQLKNWQIKKVAQTLNEIIRNNSSL